MRARLLLLMSVVAVVLATGTGTAAAHGDEGELTITRLEQIGPTSVAIEVGIVYEGDGHLAEDATVTATLTGPGGATVGPVPLTRTGSTTSLYAATVEVPGTGDWSVAVTSTEPEASGTQAVTVAEQAPATTSTTQAPGTTEAAQTEASTTAPTSVDAEPVTATQATDDEESAPNPALVVGACMVLAAIVIGGAVLVARSKASDAASGDDAAAGD